MQNTGPPRYPCQPDCPILSTVLSESSLRSIPDRFYRRELTGPVARMMKVLIVDDNKPMRRIIRSFIEDLTSLVYECADGRAAMGEFEKRRPDWVLMDIKMGEVDGLAATRQIKAAFPDAKIVMVTSYDEQSLRDEAKAAGACAYVLKENLRELTKILGGKVRMEN